jgi:predicted metal-dependent phosphoesterase TrpH
MNGRKRSVFRKSDLHVHTPASACFGDKSVSPERIVDTALSMGLEVIAITDHNTVSAVDDVRRAVEGKHLFAFPGIEFSTREGHVVALFELNTPTPELEDVLDAAGIARDGRGDAITLTREGMESVLKTIEERNGIAIAAHIERFPSGFLESNQPRSLKMRIHASPYLSALEITIPQNKEKWNAGEVRGYPAKHACIQGSDAHSLADIGRRPTCIRMDQVNLSALRRAFLEHEKRIRFPGG